VDDTTAADTGLGFYTSTNGTSIVENMRLYHNGSLTVTGSINAEGQFFYATGNNASMEVRDSGSLTQRVTLQNSNGASSFNYYGGNLKFRDEASTVAMTIEDSTGEIGIGTESPSYPLQVNGGISGFEKSADPAEPAEGEFVIWMSDGTGKGDDGDVMIASQAGGVTNYGTLFDHSAGAAW